MARRALASAGQGLAWLVILGALAALGTAVVVPRLGGATPYDVRTGSMRPELPPGTLVVIEPVDAGEVRIGDVVTYQRESGHADVVTHRVVGIGHDGTGQTWLRTQGDANGAPDAGLVRSVQLKGRLWYAVPHLGRLHSLLDEQQHRTAVLLATGALAGYALVMLAGAARARPRHRAASA